MRRPLLLALAAFFVAAPAFAWNGAGHRLVAAIAWDNLDTSTRQAAAELLRTHPDRDHWLLKSRYYAAESQDYVLFVEASTWADDIRPSRPNTGPWHYVNIPGGASGYNAQRDCRRGCVVSAIEQSLRLLQDLSKGWAIRQRHAWTSPVQR